MIEENKNYLDDCECKEPKRKHCYDDDYDYECRKPEKHHCHEDYDCECRKPRRNHCYEECFIVKKSCSCAPKPGKALLRCARGAVGPLPLIAADVLLPKTYPVGSVTIDTRELCNPTVLLNFNFLINVPVGLLTTLTFSVFKCCDGCRQPVGESFTFSELLPAGLANKSFSFQICDCSNCCGCETYSVEVTSATLLGAGVSIVAQLSALAVENFC